MARRPRPQHTRAAFRRHLRTRRAPHAHLHRRRHVHRLAAHAPQPAITTLPHRPNPAGRFSPHRHGAAGHLAATRINSLVHQPHRSTRAALCRLDTHHQRDRRSRHPNRPTSHPQHRHACLPRDLPRRPLRIMGSGPLRPRRHRSRASRPPPRRSGAHRCRLYQSTATSMARRAHRHSRWYHSLACPPPYLSHQNK